MAGSREGQLPSRDGPAGDGIGEGYSVLFVTARRWLRLSTRRMAKVGSRSASASMPAHAVHLDELGYLPFESTPAHLFFSSFNSSTFNSSRRWRRR
jgi:hypothetical protein